MNNLLKQTVIYLISILGGIFIVSLAFHILASDSSTIFMDTFYNVFFFTVVFLFCLALITFVTERGFFNSIQYSINHFRATISERYRIEVMGSNDLKDRKSMTQHFKEKYLYKDHKFAITFPLLFSTIILMLALIVMTSLVYGI